MTNFMNLLKNDILIPSKSSVASRSVGPSSCLDVRPKNIQLHMNSIEMASYNSSRQLVKSKAFPEDSFRSDSVSLELKDGLYQEYEASFNHLVPYSLNPTTGL